MTQGEVAAALGVDRTALVRIESGQRQLNAIELFALADTLRVPPAHFMTRPPVAMVSRRSALRDRPTSADRIRFRLEVELETQARDAGWLADRGLLSPPELKPPIDRDARALARYARQHLGRPSGPLDSMADVAERLGVYLTVVDIDADGASMLMSGYSVAVIGAASDPGRRRWTAAHEIGHHLFQDEYTAEVGGVAASRDEREQIVDAFAGEFLLPEADLRQALSDVYRDDLREQLVALAAEYRLSWSAVVGRARQVGVVSAAEAQHMRADIPVRGDFLAIVGREPQPDLQLGERGAQWKRAVLRAYRDRLITAARVVELVGGGLTIDDVPDSEER